jgi:hypothetical protein
VDLLTGTLEDYRWLVSDSARPWLQRAREDLAAQRVPGVSLVNRLRKDLSAERAHLVVEQVDLRARAREKFSRADRMFFTRKGLEQATDEQVAAYKASRFPAGSIADLCCGIGGDLVALAQRGSAAGFDVDEVARLLAEANAEACGLARDRCCTFGDDAATCSAVSGFDAWHCDPDRRSEGRRTVQGEHFEPSLESVAWLLGHNLQGAIKVAPATLAPPNWQENAELQWLGSRGECRQQVAWFGSLASHPGRRSATVVDAAGGPRTVVGTGDETIPAAASLGRFLYEPHNAVLAAKLTGALCGQHALAAVAPGIAYLTSDSQVADSALAAFEVQDVLPFDQKQLKAWCREKRIGRLEIKKRGVDVDPQKLRKAIASEGEQSATLIVTRLDSKVRVMVVRRVTGTNRD